MVSVQGCISGLAFGFKLRGLQDFTKGFLTKLALRGWRRHHVVENRRCPVSFQLLHDVGGRLGVSAGAVPFSFFHFLGALRLGELLSPSSCKAGGLLFEDMDLYPLCFERFQCVCSNSRAGEPLLVHLDDTFLLRFQFTAVFRSK